MRAAIDPKTAKGHLDLADGTTLDVALGAGAIALPSGFSQATADSDLATCDACGKVDDLGSGRLRVRVTTTKQDTLKAGALSLDGSGSFSRLRWDVVVLR